MASVGVTVKVTVPVDVGVPVTLIVPVPLPEMVNPVEFVQRDMDCTAMGVPLGQTPFEDRKRLKNGLEVTGIPTTTCYTGDSFVTEAHPVFHLEVIDMEAYALARVCDAFDVPRELGGLLGGVVTPWLYKDLKYN